MVVPALCVGSGACIMKKTGLIWDIGRNFLACHIRIQPKHPTIISTFSILRQKPRNYQPHSKNLVILKPCLQHNCLNRSSELLIIIITSGKRLTESGVRDNRTLQVNRDRRDMLIRDIHTDRHAIVCHHLI